MKDIILSSDLIDTPDDYIFDHSVLGPIRIHSVGLDSIDVLRKFYRDCYRPGYILGDEKLFHWLFKNNGGQVVVISIDGVIIAHQGYVPIVFTNGLKDYRGFISASTMVSEKYRRKGLMTYLRSGVQKNYEMAVSLGGSELGVALYSSMGYKYLGDLIRVIAIVDPALCNVTVKDSHQLQKTTDIFDVPNEKVRKINYFRDIRDEIDDLRKKVFTPGTFFSVKRDFEFLDWRYNEVPYHTYEKFGLWRGDFLDALVVFRKEFVKESGSFVIRILELFGDFNSTQELLRGTVLNKRFAEDVGWVDWHCSNKIISDNIKPLGFKTAEELLPAVVTIFTKPVDFYKTKYPYMFWSKDESVYGGLPDFDNWYVTKGDGDADRPTDNPTN